MKFLKVDSATGIACPSCASGDACLSSAAQKPDRLVCALREIAAGDADV